MAGWRRAAHGFRPMWFELAFFRRVVDNWAIKLSTSCRLQNVSPEVSTMRVPELKPFRMGSMAAVQHRATTRTSNSDSTKTAKSKTTSSSTTKRKRARTATATPPAALQGLASEAPAPTIRVLSSISCLNRTSLCVRIDHEHGRLAACGTWFQANVVRACVFSASCG